MHVWPVDACIHGLPRAAARKLHSLSWAPAGRGFTAVTDSGRVVPNCYLHTYRCGLSWLTLGLAIATYGAVCSSTAWGCGSSCGGGNKEAVAGGYTLLMCAMDWEAGPAHPELQLCAWLQQVQNKCGPSHRPADALRMLQAASSLAGWSCGARCACGRSPCCRSAPSTSTRPRTLPYACRWGRPAGIPLLWHAWPLRWYRCQ